MVIPTPEEENRGEEWEVSDDEDGQERYVEHTQKEDTWGDWAICIGGEIMNEIRAEVRKRLGYTCSAVRIAGLRLSQS